MPTDEQIEAAAKAAYEANKEAIEPFGQKMAEWDSSALPALAKPHWRKIARAALEAAERVANAELRNRKEARDAD